MYLVDTNVLSELRKARTGRADRNVVAWAAGQASSLLFVSVITVLELERGALLVQRRDAAGGLRLQAWLRDHVLAAFADRLLPIDLTVARRCASLHVPDPKPDRDSLIAATALVHGMTVVTRNVSDFAATGAATLNPWED